MSFICKFLLVVNLQVMLLIWTTKWLDLLKHFVFNLYVYSFFLLLLFFNNRNRTSFFSLPIRRCKEKENTTPYNQVSSSMTQAPQMSCSSCKPHGFRNKKGTFTNKKLNITKMTLFICFVFHKKFHGKIILENEENCMATDIWIFSNPMKYDPFMSFDVIVNMQFYGIKHDIVL